MDNNRISERGTYDELIQHNGAFAEFLRTHLKELEVDDEEGGCARNSLVFLASLSDYRLAIARCVPVPVVNAAGSPAEQNETCICTDIGLH